MAYTSPNENITAVSGQIKKGSSLTGEVRVGSPSGGGGFSPVAKVSQTDDGAVITITDKSGTTTATITNGKDGYTPQKNVDYFDGKDGNDGQDGTSPIVSVSSITGGHRITITDKNGTKNRLEIKFHVMIIYKVIDTKTRFFSI